MSNLGSYLQAKLNKSANTSPSKLNSLEVPSERLSRSMEFSSTEELDYSPASDFWSNTNLRVNEERLSRISQGNIEKAIPMSLPREIDSKSTVSALLKKFKSHGPIDKPLPMKVVSNDSISEANLDKKMENLVHLVETVSSGLSKDIQNTESLIAKSLSAEAENLSSKIAECKATQESSFLKTIEAIQGLSRQKNSETNDSDALPIQTLLKEFQELQAKDHSKILERMNFMSQAFMQEILQIRKTNEIGVLSANSTMVDRPTRNLIAGMNDKLIQLSKLSQHEFGVTENKLLMIEKRLNVLDTIVGSMDKLQVTIKQNRARATSANSDSDSTSKYPNEELILDHYGHIYSELLHLRTRTESDRALGEERMLQFMSMFTILQDAHKRLNDNMLDQKKVQDEILEIKSSVAYLQHQNQEIIRLLSNKK